MPGVALPADQEVRSSPWSGRGTRRPLSYQKLADGLTASANMGRARNGRQEVCGRMLDIGGRCCQGSYCEGSDDPQPVCGRLGWVEPIANPSLLGSKGFDLRAKADGLMVSFLQMQHRPTEEWSRAGWCEIAGAEARQHLLQADAPALDNPHDFSFATTLAGLRRFLTERDDVRAWPTSFGTRRGVTTVPGAGGTRGRDVAAPNDGEARCAPTGPSQGTSIWGSWQ